MNEKVLSLGENKSLTGILADPGPSRSDVAFVLLNAGLIHRVGPNRLSVKLARALGDAGVASIRFDISGLGDSEPRLDGLSYHQSRFEEARNVMDHLETKMGICRFVLLGLCTGADHAFRMAVQDPRVVGAVMLDGYCYRTPRFYVRHYGPRFFRWRVWWNLLRRSGSAVKRLSRVNNDSPLDNSTFVMDVPPRAEAESMLKQLVNRDVKLLFTITGNQFELYNYASQFRDMYPSVDVSAVHVEFWPDVDHTFTRLSHQQRLIDTVVDWTTRSFPAVKEVV